MKRSISPEYHRGPAHCCCPMESISWTSWGQFHQHFTGSFCKCRFQKCKKILTTWLNFYAVGICECKHVDEIDTWLRRMCTSLWCCSWSFRLCSNSNRISLHCQGVTGDRGNIELGKKTFQKWFFWIFHFISVNKESWVATVVFNVSLLHAFAFSK